MACSLPGGLVVPAKCAIYFELALTLGSAVVIYMVVEVSSPLIRSVRVCVCFLVEERSKPKNFNLTFSVLLPQIALYKRKNVIFFWCFWYICERTLAVKCLNTYERLASKKANRVIHEADF